MPSPRLTDRSFGQGVGRLPPYFGCRLSAPRLMEKLWVCEEWERSQVEQVGLMRVVVVSSFRLPRSAARRAGPCVRRTLHHYGSVHPCLEGWDPESGSGVPSFSSTTFPGRTRRTGGSCLGSLVPPLRVHRPPVVALVPAVYKGSDVLQDLLPRHGP